MALPQQQYRGEIHQYQQLISTNSSSLRLKEIPVKSYAMKPTTLLRDMSTGQARPLKWRKVFKVVHGLSHPSVRATKQLLTTKFVWNGMQRDVRNWAKQCIACQSSKIQTHIKATLNKITVSKDSFNHIHVELVGLPSKGYTICSPS